jgi:phage shock protein E
VSKSAGHDETTKEEKMPTPIDRHQVQWLRREEHAQLVEVLPPDEFEDEHLPAALNIPLKALDRNSTDALDCQRPVIVYCYDYQ